MRSSRIKLSICLILILALSCLSVLSACNNSNEPILRESTKSSGGQDVALTFFGYKADAINLTAIEGAIQSFMDQNKDLKISYESIKGEAYWDAFDKRDQAGELDDIFMMHHDHVISMSSENKLADLSDIPGIENFTDEARSQFINDDGTIYFLPTSNSTYNLYINEDLLKKHGQSAPTNWVEFKQVCDYFASQGIVPIVANNRHSLTSLMVGIGLFDLYQLPEDELEATLAAFNDDPSLYANALAPGVEIVNEMLERGWIDPVEALATEQTSDDLEIFAQGGRPFLLSGGWASGRVKAKNPSFTFGVYPYPVLEDGSVLPIQIDTCISVNANGPYLEEAKEFVTYLIQPDVMWEYCDNQASFTPLNDDRIPSEPALAPTIDYLSNGRIVLRSDYRLSIPTEKALSAASMALLNGKNSEEAQAEMARVLSQGQ